MMGIFDGLRLPDLGQPNPGQYGPPAPGSLNNPLKPPGFDLGQPNPGEYGPPAPGSTNNPPERDLWGRLMNAVGQGAPPKMPGTTIGAPAGQAAPPPPPSPLPQGQMPAPPGMNAYFRALGNPTAGASNGGLMAQYMALQQLMRGA